MVGTFSCVLWICWCLMLDPYPLSEKLVEWGIERRYVFPFQSLYITSLFKDHDQGNMPIRLIPVSKIFEIDGKSPKICFFADHLVECHKSFGFWRGRPCSLWWKLLLYPGSTIISPLLWPLYIWESDSPFVRICQTQVRACSTKVQLKLSHARFNSWSALCRHSTKNELRPVGRPSGV